ncbi:MAG: amidohydrolase family protein [Solirubrobacteraceae bacterium]
MSGVELPQHLQRRYEAALAPFEAEARQLLPAGAEIIDAHTHLGHDEDGRSLTLQELLSQLDAAGATRACVFALHDPERVPSYTLPNDRVLGWAAESEGRLIPFCRLDPAEAPIAEAERALSRGARGIKLHPRAQEFGFESEEMESIFALAGQAGVPILIHAGRGMPPIADGLTRLALGHPDTTLILAHGAICDQGTIATRLADHPRVLYDTSCFFPIDVIELFARVPAERIVFATDPPYGMTPSGLYMALRVAAQAGLPEPALRSVLGGTVASLFEDGQLPEAVAPRRGATVVFSGRLARVGSYASLAGPALFGGSGENALSMLEMALAACRDPEPGADGQALATISTALETAAQLLREGGLIEPAVRRAIDLVFRSSVHAATSVLDGATPPAVTSNGADGGTAGGGANRGTDGGNAGGGANRGTDGAADGGTEITADAAMLDAGGG